jgi:hypothetical protein
MSDTQSDLSLGYIPLSEHTLQRLLINDDRGFLERRAYNYWFRSLGLDHNSENLRAALLANATPETTAAVLSFATWLASSVGHNAIARFLELEGYKITSTAHCHAPHLHEPSPPPITIPAKVYPLISGFPADKLFTLRASIAAQLLPLHVIVEAPVGADMYYALSCTGTVVQGSLHEYHRTREGFVLAATSLTLGL